MAELFEVSRNQLQELLGRSRESALSAVQIFNNPLTVFKLESFIVLMVIAWRCLLHAYYQRKGVQYWETNPSHSQSRRYWGLRECLAKPECPLDSPTKENLKFIYGLRNEIEHHYSEKVTYNYSARYIACCRNYERVITKLFGDEYSIGSHLYLAIHFQDMVSDILPDDNLDILPTNIANYISDFEAELSEEDFHHPHFAYRVFFARKLTNKRGQADRVIEFVDINSEIAKEIDKEYWFKKEVEKPKYLPKYIVEAMRRDGFPLFNMHHHTQLWKQMGAKNPGRGYGVDVSGKWYWYEQWLEEVRNHCEKNRRLYESSIRI